MTGRQPQRAMAALAALLLAAPAWAEAKKPANDEAIERLETALRVAEWARASGDAQGLTVAAAMLASVETRTRDDRGEIEVPKPPAEGSPRRERRQRHLPPPAALPPPPPPPPAPPPPAVVMERATPTTIVPPPLRPPLPVATPQALLDEAEQLSGGNPAILAGIAAQRQQAAKGVTASSFGAGPVRVSREIPAKAAWRIALTVRGGDPLHMIAIGDGDTDIDLEIRDARGRLVCDDRSPGHYARCSLTPAFAGQYTARIINRGLIKTLATLVSN